MKYACLCLISVLCLSACGNKGPLYLPEQVPDQPKQEKTQ